MASADHPILRALDHIAKRATHTRVSDQKRAGFAILMSGDPNNGSGPVFRVDTDDEQSNGERIFQFQEFLRQLAVEFDLDFVEDHRSIARPVEPVKPVEPYEPFKPSAFGPFKPSAFGIPATAELGGAIEVFVELWHILESELPLDPEDRRIGDALADMAMEVSLTSNPPRGVLKSALSWFAGKADRFFDEFAGAAGKAAGGTAVLAVGAAASGHLDDLKKAIGRVLSLL